MKWRPHRRHVEVPPDNGIDEAHEALERQLDAWPAVRATAHEIHRISTENHLGEKTHYALAPNREG